jgi:UDP-N-acetylmuramoylalanine--D-glutamate ligase
MISLHHKKIGIWGFGLVGKSALHYATEEGAKCSIFDQRELNRDEQDTIEQQHGTVEKNLELFLNSNDYILPSPGVDISSYKQKHFFICELDLFASRWLKPSIAITGSVGKTTVTTLISTLLAKKMPVATGGNIGTPMLSLIEEQDNVDIGVLELSSWQLEHSRSYAPDIAIITNLYPNHLDRHLTMENYLLAKANIFKHQQTHQALIAPLHLQQQLLSLSVKSKCIWVSNKRVQMNSLNSSDHILFFDNDMIIYRHNNIESIIVESWNLSRSIMIENWLFALATLLQLNLPANLAFNCSLQLEHRIEKIATIGNTTFYNDSKATTVEATLAAIEQFKNEKIVLFLGGLSKGVDRSTLIAQLPSNVISVICFGNEADQLKQYCEFANRHAHSFCNLKEAFNYAVKYIQNATVALLSPSGSSYDLYTNYEERGRHFKDLVHAMIKKQ